MIPPDVFFLLQKRRHEELMRQAEQARLVRVSRRPPGSDIHAFQPLLWWVGETLLSWGCALQQTGRANVSAEKGDCLCL
jgi:hypothetical protein